MGFVGLRPARAADVPATTSAPASGPAREEKADAINKQRLAEQLQAEAEDQLKYAQAGLREIETQLEQAADDARETARLEDDLDYWRRREAYEQRQLAQADLHQRAGQEKQELSRLITRKRTLEDGLDPLTRTRRELSPEEREAEAVRFRQEADAARERADKLHERATAEARNIPPMQQRLPSFDADEQALWERLQQAGDVEEYRRLSSHLRRMRRQLDIERQQTDLMITTMENIVFVLQRQGDLEREIGETSLQCAEVLVPSVPPFWERHRSIINSILILVAVVGMSYGVKLVVWLVRGVLTYLGTTMTEGRFSVKRATTLVSFGGSIAKLFVWIFGVVWILNEFGIDPAKSTGAIGLVGLIMAGMFQQIVVDFVKGLDIIAGRHYNVGDFVEVAGKFGHVVDFNVKYTRIRTASGTEFNLPNSQCLPSRRFPDGYINNYVDLTLESSADEQRAKEAIDPVCRELNHRIEPVRDVPALVRQFPGPRGRMTLRYRVRVLPGSPWVLTDYFIPTVKAALAEQGVGLAAEPTSFFINRIDTFRKLFSRQLSEHEIVRQATQEAVEPAADEDASQLTAAGPEPAPAPDQDA